MTLDETMLFSQPHARINRRVLLLSSLLLLFPTLGSSWMVPRSSNLLPGCRRLSFINERATSTALWGNLEDMDRNRRSITLGAAALVAFTRPVWARSRTDGYSVQRTQEEWKEQLSPLQYNILREGDTERPYLSILESEVVKEGVFKCAGCRTELFRSSDKFKSGTGWPSFARALPGVEVDQVDPIMANLAGAEVRCRTCGGHLGDVFNDGFLFVGTEAARTGKRFCIDGAALLLYPTDGGAVARGDVRSSPKQEPNWLTAPKIAPRNREES
jgi:peptide-methionine (R)-S-oxide reductase